MKESDMVGMLLGPMVDELGMDRASAAMEMGKPVFEALTALMTNAETKQPKQKLATMDTFRVLELWCKAIREIGEQQERNEFPDTIGGD